MDPQDFDVETMGSYACHDMEEPRRLTAQIMKINKPIVVISGDGRIATFNNLAASKMACPAWKVLGTPVNTWIQSGKLTYNDVYEIAREPAAATTSDS